MISYQLPLYEVSARVLRAPFFFIVLLLLGGCVSTPQSDQLASRNLAGEELSQVAFFPQDEYQCGPAALATVLAESGVEVAPEALTEQVYVRDRQGSFQVEMLAAARRHQRIPYVIAPSLEQIVEALYAQQPVLVLQNLGLSWYPRWHYAVVVGYNPGEHAFVLRSGKIERRITGADVFENTWRRSDYWGVVLLKPGDLPALVDEQQYFLALNDFAPVAKANELEKALQAGAQRWPASTSLGMALANFYYEAGDLHNAQAAYTQLLTQYPAYAPAHNNLALVLLDLGQRPQALMHARLAVEQGGRYVDNYRETLSRIQNPAP